MDIDYDVPYLKEKCSEWTGTYTWRVENWTKLTEEKIYSPEFEIGGYSWRLLVFPCGNKSHGSTDHISVYLDFPEASFTPPQMCPKAKFELMVVDNANPDNSLKREATHTFTSQAKDWGFSQLRSIQEVQNLQNDYLVNDALTLLVNIDLQRDDDLGMRSRLETGFLGIRSSKETNLLSSFLQCLFHIRMFRKAVYLMPTLASADTQKSLPIALRHLFYTIQYQNTSAKIKHLIKVFDWHLTIVRLQHSPLEIQRSLFQKLGEEDKTGSVRNFISDLFFGEYSNYIKSSSLQRTQIWRQSYTEIPIDVLKCKNIYASLEKLCQIDRLKEDNRCRKTSQRLQVPECYLLFDSFPSILQFNLKRCYYNPSRNAFLKINSYYEFFDELNLDYNDRVLLSKNADRTIENQYKLHSVVVHADDSEGGHYCAFIRCQDKWYKFDNEVVTAVSSVEAINAQFGDQNNAASANFTKVHKRINKSAAVMLVYIRKSDWERIMCEANKEDISASTRRNLEAEQQQKEKRRNEKTEAYLYVNIKLACEQHFAETLSKSYNFDLVDFDVVKSYRFLKNTPFEEFQEMVRKDFGIPTHLQRFWQWVLRGNETIRVWKPLNESGIDLKTVLDLRHFRDNIPPFYLEKTALMTIKLFLESPEEASVCKSNLRPIQENELLVFIKFYDSESSKLFYLGHMLIDKTCQFHGIFERAKKMAGLGPDEDVIGFEQIQYLPAVSCKELVPEATPEESQLTRGDIIVIQKVATNSPCEYPTVINYLEFLQNQRTVNFKPLKNPTEEGFKLDLLKTMTYEQVTTELAKHLKVDDPKKLRITQQNIYVRMPHRIPLKYNGIESLEEMILHGRQFTHVLYYEVLDMQLPHLETLKCFTIGFHDAKGELQSEHHLRLPKDKKVSDLAKALKLELGEEYSDSNMRIMETLSSKVFKVWEPESVLEKLYEKYWTFRAEIIPEDQKDLTPEEYLVLFCHWKPEGNCRHVFGDPLWIKVKLGETVRKVKARVQKILEISDEEFRLWKFAYHARPMHPIDYLKDEDEILAKFLRIRSSGRTDRKFVGDNTTFIALVHKDTRPGGLSLSLGCYNSNEQLP